MREEIGADRLWVRQSRTTALAPPLLTPWLHRVGAMKAPGCKELLTEKTNYEHFSRLILIVVWAKHGTPTCPGPVLSKYSGNQLQAQASGAGMVTEPCFWKQEPLSGECGASLICHSLLGRRSGLLHSISLFWSPASPKHFLLLPGYTCPSGPPAPGGALIVSWMPAVLGWWAGA